MDGSDWSRRYGEALTATWGMVYGNRGKPGACARIASRSFRAVLFSLPSPNFGSKFIGRVVRFSQDCFFNVCIKNALSRAQNREYAARHWPLRSGAGWRFSSSKARYFSISLAFSIDESREKRKPRSIGGAR